MLVFLDNGPHLLLLMYVKMLVYYKYFYILAVICHCPFQAKEEKWITGSLTKKTWSGQGCVVV